MEHSTLILMTLIGYKLCLLGVGVWAQRRTHGQEDFFLGGRSLGPVVAALSYSASSSSAWTLLGFSGLAYAIGVSAVWVGLGAVAGMLVAWFWIAPRLRGFSLQHHSLTLTEFLAHDSHGHWRLGIIWAASFIILVSFAFYIAAQFQGAGSTFASSFSMDASQAIVLGGVIIMVYTFLGGFWAVSVTDAIQGALMAVASFILPLAAWLAVGGVQGLTEGLQATGQAQLLSTTHDVSGLLGLGFVIGSIATGLGAFGQPHLLVRFMALRDDKALRQARLLAVVWFILVFGGMFLLGLCCRVLFPGLENSETVFFEASLGLLPGVFGALVLAAVLSAIMSTADSQLLVGASTISHDLGLARRYPNTLLLISRFSIAVLTVLAIALAIVVPSSIFNRVLFAWAALGAAFGPLVFARLAGRNIPAPISVCAILLGFVSTVVFYLLPNTVGDIAERLLPFLLASLLVYFGSRQVTRPEHA